MAVHTIGIVGAGTMGAGIAHVAAATGLGVVLIDINEPLLSKAMERVDSGFGRLVAKGQKMSPDGRQAALRSIQTATAHSALATADLVVEAATKNADVEEKILRSVAEVVQPDATVATDTSSVSITRLAACIADPGRFIGLHFFNPVPVMKLVEVVRGLQTTDATHEAATDIVRKLGKTPITVKNMLGFVVNRLLLPMINEAFFALAEGDARAEAINQGMKLGYNHPMGPLALADLIGLDVLLSVMEVLHHEIGDDKYRPCPVICWPTFRQEGNMTPAASPHSCAATPGDLQHLPEPAEVVTGEDEGIEGLHPEQMGCNGLREPHAANTTAAVPRVCVNGARQLVERP